MLPTARRGHMSSPSPEDLRRRYADYSDEALLAAAGAGASSYSPVAWQVIIDEASARGLAVPSSAPTLSHPVPLDIRDNAEAAAFALRSLNAGASATVIHQRLVDDGMPSAEAAVVVEQAVLVWRPSIETTIMKALLQAGLWCAGGLAITAFTYTLATSSSGTYLLAYGPVLYGGIRLFKAFGHLNAVKQQCDFPQGRVAPGAG